jgi:hypothetical protein
MTDDSLQPPEPNQPFVVISEYQAGGYRFKLLVSDAVFAAADMGQSVYAQCQVLVTKDDS